MKHKQKQMHFRTRKKWYVDQKSWNQFILEFRKMLTRKMQLHEELLNQIKRNIEEQESFIKIKLPKEIAMERDRINEEDLKTLQIQI